MSASIIGLVQFLENRLVAACLVACMARVWFSASKAALFVYMAFSY
jgi:hypothetical protein